MKITKSYLKQIIKEEMGNMQGGSNIIATSVEEFPSAYIVTIQYNGKKRSVTVPKNNSQAAQLSSQFKKEVQDAKTQEQIKDVAIAKTKEVALKEAEGNSHTEHPAYKQQQALSDEIVKKTGLRLEKYIPMAGQIKAYDPNTMVHYIFTEMGNSVRTQKVVNGNPQNVDDERLTGKAKVMFSMVK